jgi:hypothetical protein
MTKLTRAQRKELESALSCLERGLRFIESDTIALARTGKINAACSHTTEYRASPATIQRQDYTGRDDDRWHIDWIPTLEPISKGIGSDLVALYDAKRTITRLLQPDQVTA